MPEISPADRDLLIRTVIGEAADQPELGRAAVAHAVLNRVAAGNYGSSPAEVVLARGQFEPWSTRPKELLAYKADSKVYKSTARIVDDVLAGKIDDPTGGATHFLEPEIVKKRAGKLPDWAAGPGLKIGDHAFYRPQKGGVAAINRAIGQQPTAPAGAAMSFAGETAGGSASAHQPGSVLGRFGFAPDGSPAGVEKPAEEVAPGAVLKLFGHDIEPGATAGKMAPAGEAPGQTTRAVPEIRAAAERLSRARGPIQPVIEGAPIVGPAIEAASSAIGAAVQPYYRDAGDSTFGERFRANLEATREANALYAKEHPKTALGGNLLGGIAVLGPAAATGPGALALGMRGPTLGARFYTGMGGGAAINALDAAAREQNVGQGAAIGAATGAAGPLIGEVARSATRAIANRAFPPSGPLRDLNSVASGHLVNALGGETPASLSEGVRRMGPAGFLADINPALTDLAGGIADTPGPGKEIIREAYRQRAAEAAGRIDATVTRSMGPPTNIVEHKQFLTEARKAAADPLYAQWRGMQVHPTDELKALVPRLDKAGAFDAAEKISGITGEPINRAFFTGGPQKAYPTTQTWDYVKRGLDSKIDQAYASGDKTVARHLIDLRSEMISEIERTNAGHVWRQARTEFADRSALMDQIDRGRDTFLGSRSGLSVDEFRHELTGLGGPELAARIQGARAAVTEAMGDSIRGQTTMRDKLLARNNQEKLRLLLGDDRANAMVRDLESERFLTAQDQNVRGGSQTTPKKERVNALQAAALPGWNPSLSQPLTWLPPHMVEQLRPTSIIEGARGQRHANALAQLAPLLTMAPDQTMAELIAAIRAEGGRQGRSAAAAEHVGRGVTGLVAPAGSMIRLRNQNALFGQ